MAVLNMCDVHMSDEERAQARSQLQAFCGYQEEEAVTLRFTANVEGVAQDIVEAVFQ